jgi:transketolase C-terminal domain/subunit
VFRSFNWNVLNVDATQYNGVYAALEQFRFGPRNGRPTAIICHATKGHGALSDFLNKHKVTVPDALLQQEMSLQADQRRDRVSEFIAFHEGLRNYPDGGLLQETLIEFAGNMRLNVERTASDAAAVTQVIGPVVTQRVRPRNKRIDFDGSQLPVLDRSKQYAASDVVTAAMKVFARDPRIVSIDADLATTSGLEAGVAAVDQRRALNVGVAEANMMGIGEAFAALGFNTWISTFCPFYDWKVLRRIAVGHQERMEAMTASDGWLSEGHGLDLTMLATAANFETRTNGATHMGNDDNLTFDAVAHLKIIDISCPQQMLALMKWVMAGNRGLLYVRLMRTPSAVLYDASYEFEFGKASFVHGAPGDAAFIVSSGRGVHEAIAAARVCEKSGAQVAVVDMSSIDEDLLLELCSSGKVVCLAEQNNGYILQNVLKVQYRRTLGSDPRTPRGGQTPRIIAMNTLDRDGRPQFIHSGTYEELIEAFALTPAHIAKAVLGAMTERGSK